jgi:hypothetical protein
VLQDFFLQEVELSARFRLFLLLNEEFCLNIKLLRLSPQALRLRFVFGGLPRTLSRSWLLLGRVIVSAQFRAISDFVFVVDRVTYVQSVRDILAEDLYNEIVVLKLKLSLFTC